MLVFSLARASLSVSQDATRAESLLHHRSPSDFDLNASTSVTNIKLVKFQGNAQSSLFVVVKSCMLV